MNNYSWSYSAFSSAIRCLKLFKYVYIDKIKSETPESGDLIFGSALHSAINASLTGGNGSEVFELYWNSYQNKEIDYGRFKWQELASIGSEFLRKFDKSHAKKHQFKFGEKRLYAEYKGIKFEGTPDFYGTYNGKSSLRDFKTSGYNYSKEKIDTALQLYLYAYLIRQNNIGTIDTMGYTVFNKGVGSIQDLTWDFKEEKMYEALDEMAEYINLWKAKDDSISTYPKNYTGCLYPRRCEFIDVCFPKGGNDDKE